MKHNYSFCTFLTACALVLAFPSAAFADDDREEISSVYLTIEADYDDEDDEDIENMDLDIYTDDDTYYVDDYEITGISSSNPVVEVTLIAEDEYYFSVSSDDIELDGEDAELSSKSTRNDKETLVLKLKLTDISTEIDSNDLGDVTLDTDGVGYWDDVGDAKKYEVRFYRGSTRLDDEVITTKNTEYYFGSMITKNGSYYFKVRAISVDDEESDWVDSNTLYFSYDPEGTDPTNFYSGGKYDKETYNDDKDDSRDEKDDDTEDASYASYGWIWDGTGWWYAYEDDTYPASEWVFIDENWYHFDANGYMQTGWLLDGGRYYYLNPVSDGTLGRMIVGWHWIGDKCYYFNPASDGTKGALITNAVIDGQYRVGADGAMIQ